MRANKVTQRRRLEYHSVGAVARVAGSRGDPVVGSARICRESGVSVVPHWLSQSVSREEVEGGGGAWRAKDKAVVFDRLQVDRFHWDKL